MKDAKETPGNQRNGWLDPQGRFFPIREASLHCDWCAGHHVLSCRKKSDYHPDCDLDKQGWFKLTNGKWIIAHPLRMSQQQFNYIMDWHAQNGEALDNFVRFVKEAWEEAEDS